jgi:L-fuconate dehydratase
VTRLHTDCGLSATGVALTLGSGNRLICEAIELLAEPLVGLPIEELMADTLAKCSNMWPTIQRYVG